jgi:hypothetical protein
MVKMAHNQREMRLGLFFQSTHALGDFTSRCLLFLSINSQLLFWFELVVVFVSQFPAAHRRQLFVKKVFISGLAPRFERISIPDTTYQPAKVPRLCISM